MWTKHSFFNYNRLNPFLSVCKWHGFTNCGVYGIQFRHLTQKQLRMQPQKLPFYLPPPPYPPTGAPNQCQCQLPCSCQSWLRPHMQLIGVRFSQMCCACVYVRVREWVCVLANCWLTLSAERLTFCDHCQKQKKTKKKRNKMGQEKSEATALLSEKSRTNCWKHIVKRETLLRSVRLKCT